MAILTSHSGRLTVLVLLAAILAVKCGDPLVDKSYQGTPLITLQGQTYGTAANVDVNNPVVRIAVFWLPTTDALDPDTFFEQVSTGQNIKIPYAFIMNIFEAPADDWLVTDQTSRFGVGIVQAYVDANGNGQRDANEPVSGVDGGRIIFYAPTHLSADVSPTSGEVEAGYHLSSLPLACGHVEPSRPTGGTCGVPLGQKCRGNNDCGAGNCLQTFLQSWPEGSCAIRESQTGCVPEGSVILRGPPTSTEAYWIKGCHTNQDCGRDYPYVCDLKNSACLPTGSLSVQVADALKRIEICPVGPVMGDGGMMMPRDGGSECPAGPNGESPPRFSDGGCPGPNEMMGCMGPDGGMMPRFPDGGCPGPNMMMGCPGPDGGTLPKFPDGGCPMGPPS